MHKQAGRSSAGRIATFAMHTRARTRSGGREPAVAWGIAWPARLRTYPHTVVGRVTRSRGREPAVATGDALAKVLPQLFGRLSSVRWRTLLQSRCRNHGGLRPPRSCCGEHAFVQRKSRFFTAERTTCARSGGREPTVVREPHVHSRLRKCSGDCRRRVGERRCNRGGETTGAYALRSCSRGVRPPGELRLLRCTNAHAPRAAGVSPPCLQEPRLQRQFRTHSDTVVAHAPGTAGVSPPWV